MVSQTGKLWRDILDNEDAEGVGTKGLLQGLERDGSCQGVSSKAGVQGPTAHGAL